MQLFRVTLKPIRNLDESYNIEIQVLLDTTNIPVKRNTFGVNEGKLPRGGKGGERLFLAPFILYENGDIHFGADPQSQTDLEIQESIGNTDLLDGQPIAVGKRFSVKLNPNDGELEYVVTSCDALIASATAKAG